MCFSLYTNSLYLLVSTLLSNSQQLLPSSNLFSAFSQKGGFYQVSSDALSQLLFSPTSLVTIDHSLHRTFYLLSFLDAMTIL